MFEVALKLLEKIEDQGFRAYIVGGFVRDYILGIESNDIDICTNARPKDIRSIFKDACLPSEDYGSITVILKHIRFEITTFRREYSYINHRKPDHFEFINDLNEDLQRRDFSINTLCIDRNGEILDLLNGRRDIDQKIIRTVGNSYQKFTEDALRILRAVRFATILQFQLSDEVKIAILKTKSLLKKISYQRKREELDKIFTSVHVKEGVQLLLDLGLDQELELVQLSSVSKFDDLIGIWTQLDVLDLYPFSNNERELMTKIKKVLEFDTFDSFILYKYGLYVTSIAAYIRGISKKKVTAQYNLLPIKCRSDIVLNGRDISEILGKDPGPYLRDILDDLEKKILSLDLLNEREVLISYIRTRYC